MTFEMETDIHGKAVNSYVRERRVNERTIAQ